MLQQREAKLLGDRRQLEKSVNILTNKIAELEDMLQKPRSEKQPTHLAAKLIWGLGASLHRQ
jgi:hypothetical protein